ncbi:hypothetical protein ACLD0W_09725 [Alloalcanivorax sp. C16-1]|uniref:hypothetical protein n=1 Tax=Alloalcanivorax sp. C16-1 TaxID=3390051 RepID=UPI0039704895
MKRDLLLSAFLAAATWSLSSLAAADWDTGPCQGGGTAPCIEAEVSGTTYLFNGSGDYAGEWHGLPTNGEDFEFSGATTWGCSGLNFNCTWTWGAQIKKCQDKDGNWRIGLRVNSASMSGGAYCALIGWEGFPWYTKDTSISSHCPFNDSCENLIPYVANATTYNSNIGPIDFSTFGITRITGGHMHGLLFTPGIGARLDFSSAIYSCDEDDEGCEANGTLTVTNATSLDIR